jgi:drug/metabolite transporter (DMT)-like permease
MGYEHILPGELKTTESTILFAGLRFAIAGFLTVVIYSVARHKFLVPKRKNIGRIAIVCVFQTIVQYFFFYIGVANTASVKGAIIQGLNAFVAILIACFLFRTERMNLLKWIGGLLGVAGVVAVNLNGGTIDMSVSLMGEGFLMVSMLAGACSAGLIKRYGQHDDPVALSGWQFMLGGAVMAIGAFLMGGRLHPQNIGAVLVLLYLALLSAVAYTVWSLLLKVNPVSRIAVYMFLQPVFGVLLSLILYGSSDVPLVRYALALALVSLSIVIVGKGQQAEKK